MCAKHKTTKHTLIQYINNSVSALALELMHILIFVANAVPAKWGHIYYYNLILVN